jgi:hypothetical protein
MPRARTSAPLPSLLMRRICAWPGSVAAIMRWILTAPLSEKRWCARAGHREAVARQRSRDRLHGWGERTRTRKCRFFEISAELLAFPEHFGTRDLSWGRRFVKRHFRVRVLSPQHAVGLQCVSPCSHATMAPCAAAPQGLRCGCGHRVWLGSANDLSDLLHRADQHPHPVPQQARVGRLVTVEQGDTH